jgi:hypothetical protein
MKSIALLFWLAAANGGEQLLLPIRHFDDMAACEAAAEGQAAQHAGKASRHKCHEIQPEVGEVDENGNPIKPESRLVSPQGRPSLAGAVAVK